MTETQRLPIDPARVALVVALALLLSSGDPNPTHIVFWLAIPITLAASIRWNVGLVTIVLLLIAGIAFRLAWNDKGGSDVLDVTKAAIDRALGGLNPYGYGYEVSRPPGSPFPYGPLALLVYTPFKDAMPLVELFTAFTVAAILARQGRMIGLAVYAVAPVLAQTAVDGSNDTTLGLVILLAFIAAERSALAGAVLLALATAFKLSALAFVPVFFAWAGLRASLLFVATSVIAWAPVLAAYGLDSFIASAQKANDLHSSTRWSLGVLVRELADARIPLLDQLRYVAGGLLALIGLRFRRSLDGVILVGLAVYVVTLFAGNWGSTAYLAAIAPLICWRLDDWLGFESIPVPERVDALAAAWTLRRAVASPTETVATPIEPA